jgi:hypothetical protein
VRRRVEQHCVVFHADIDIAHNAGRRRPNRNSVRFYRNRKPWSDLGSSGTNTDRVAQSWFRGHDRCRTDHAHGYISVNRFVTCDKPVPLPEWRWRNVGCERLLNTFYP